MSTEAAIETACAIRLWSLRDIEKSTSRRTDAAATDLASDSHIRTVHVPLLQGFEWWLTKTPLWEAIATTSRHVLRREDFGERVDGVILQGFMCRHACVDDLLARWRKSSYKWWVERDGEFDLVVLVEVVRVPMPLPAERRCVGQ